jgi:hypothetical protein
VARIRTIKPKFWTNEDLSALPEATHLLAAGLLNYADDEGYFNANPGLIKAECSPLREPSVSIPESLRLLAGIGYLRLGIAADGKRYGQIVKFDEHQRVNRPTASTIKGLGIAWESSEQTHSQLSEPSPPEGKGREEEGKGKEEEQSAPPAGGAPRAKSDPIPYADIVAAYNAAMTKLPKVRDVTPARRTAMRTAWQQSPSRQSVEFWQAYFEECAEDPFRNGTGPYKSPHENWRPDFDFLIQSKQVTRVYEAALHRMESRA